MPDLGTLLPRLAPWATICILAVIALCVVIVLRTGSSHGLRDVAALLAVVLKPWSGQPPANRQEPAARDHRQRRPGPPRRT
jgi:hypothetical protein